MRSLVVWASPAAGDAGRRAAAGARVVAWSEAADQALSKEGVPHAALRDVVLPEDRDWMDEAAILWTKEWGRRPLRDGRPFRDLVEWKGVSLWWFAELYLHHSTASPGHVRTIETFLRLVESERPQEVEAVGLTDVERVLLARTCTAKGVLFHGEVPRVRPGVLATSLRSRWNTAKTIATWLKNALRPPAAVPPPARGARRVLFLSHAAFWRERQDAATGETALFEHYFDRLIPELAATPGVEARVLGIGPRAAFRRRGSAERLREWTDVQPERGPYVHVDRFVSARVVREVWRATGEIRRAWEHFRRSPAMREAFTHRGVPFADLASEDLAGTLLLQLPWAVRSYEEMSEALAVLRPAAVCLYAESSGWGRAAVAACRAAGVATVAVQHGILYPKYYSYRHEPDERGCPRPDRTAVFGEEARRFLLEQGGYAPDAIEVTGSPKFDDLIAAARGQDVKAARARWGVGEGERLVVVASRFRPIRDTHEAIGAEIPALVAAVEALPGVHCLVKPHPAEPAAAYEAAIAAARATRTRVVPPGTDLVSLLPAADALVTVESLSAVEALVLDLPLVILSMPTNLRALVEAGVAVGVAAGADPGPALAAVLLDADTRLGLADARRRYLGDVAHGVDGRATARIVELLRGAALQATPAALGVVG